MKKLLIFITLAFTTISTYAQTDTKLDSLHTLIKSEVKQTTKVLEEQIARCEPSIRKRQL